MARCGKMRQLLQRIPKDSWHLQGQSVMPSSPRLLVKSAHFRRAKLVRTHHRLERYSFSRMFKIVRVCSRRPFQQTGCFMPLGCNEFVVVNEAILRHIILFEHLAVEVQSLSLQFCRKNQTMKKQNISDQLEPTRHNLEKRGQG